MRILYSFLIVIFTSMLFTSCVKEYKCQCKITYSGEPGLPAPHFREYKLSNTLNKAKSECAGYSKVYVNGNITTKEECELY